MSCTSVILRVHVRITQLESLESAARVILRVAPRIRHEYSRAHIEAELLMGGVRTRIGKPGLQTKPILMR